MICLEETHLEALRERIKHNKTVIYPYQNLTEEMWYQLKYQLILFDAYIILFKRDT